MLEEIRIKKRLFGFCDLGNDAQPGLPSPNGEGAGVKLLLFLPLLFFTHFLHAQPDGFSLLNDTATFKQQFDKVSKSTLNIQSDFTQEKSLSVLNEKIITSGRFFFKAPDKLRWEYVDPFEYLIVLNGKSVIIKDGEHISKYDMQANKLFREINSLMIELVQGAVLNNAKYKVKYFASQSHYLMELVPSDGQMKAFLSSIHITLNKDDYAVIGIKMTESSGDYTRITFNNRKINQPIPDDTFVVH